MFCNADQEQEANSNALDRSATAASAVPPSVMCNSQVDLPTRQNVCIEQRWVRKRENELSTFKNNTHDAIYSLQIV